MSKGTIARVMDRGFGFIKTEEGSDLFFHSNDLEGAEFNSLQAGQEVEYEQGEGRDGRPAAVKVRLIETQSDEAGDAGSGEEEDVSDEKADTAE